jgi:hypothetical protein
MRNGLALIGFLAVMVLLVTFAQSAAQTNTPTPDYSLTATFIIGAATKMGAAAGTSTTIFATQASQTAQAVQATRTSIALTRDPSLSISATPNGIQVTASQIVVEMIQTERAATLLEINTPDPLWLTTNPADMCQPSLENQYQAELMGKIRTGLAEAGVERASVNIITEGVGQLSLCGTPFYPLRTSFDIQLMVNNLSNNRDLADLTAAILSTLNHFPPIEEYGVEAARLRIVFSEIFEHKIIDTGYANALAAYEEGLRGNALLEALGGLLPT